MGYFEKLEHAPADLTWNLPEQKQGTINLVGGNSKSFRTEVKISEFVAENYPVKSVFTVLPDALSSSLPSLPNLRFLSSTESGSFASADELTESLNSADYNLLLGDFSKNSITRTAVKTAVERTKAPTLITRDAVDLLTEAGPERLLMNENLLFFASLSQLQKLLRAVYYPKVLLLSSSLPQITEVLHKFTLSYPVRLITLASGQLLLAENGEIKAISLDKPGLPPISLWGGEAAAKITALNLFSPGQFFAATLSALNS